jgi:hypothetical protein
VGRDQLRCEHGAASLAASAAPAPRACGDAAAVRRWNIGACVPGDGRRPWRDARPVRAGGRVPAAGGARLGARRFPLGSLLNTPLFAGFLGLVSKLWLADDERGRYRGLYEWDGPRQAEAYARALWRVLALVSVPGSIHYVVLPGLRRDELLARPQLLADAAADAAGWWRPVEVS